MSEIIDIDDCTEMYRDDTGEPRTLHEKRVHDVASVTASIFNGLKSLGDLARKTETADFVTMRTINDIILTAQLVGSIIDARKPPPLKVVGRAS